MPQLYTKEQVASIYRNDPNIRQEHVFEDGVPITHVFVFPDDISQQL